MGARGFAKYLARHGLGHVRGGLSQFRGQEFVIDGLNCIYGLARKHRSNVPYHFAALCAALCRNGICATLVFDGPPDKQRMQVQKHRHLQRVSRQNRLAKLQTRNLSGGNNVSRLKWQLTVPDRGDVTISKTIAGMYGFSVVDATGEADIACAVLSAKKSGVVLSSDTDLIAYQTPIVIYDVNVDDDTYTGWDQVSILNKLRLSSCQLQEVFAIMADPNITRYINISDVLFDMMRRQSVLDQYEQQFGTLHHARRLLINYQSIPDTI